MNLFRYTKNKNTVLFILSLLYFAMVVLPHELIGVWITSMFENHSRDEYNQIILILFLVLIMGFVIRFMIAIIKHKDRNKLILYSGATSALIILCFNTIIIVNIELIHIFQYAILSILLFFLLRDYQQSLVITTLAGAVDEAYQYFYLSPQRTNYYDWNDVIFNLLGAALGLIYIRAFSVQTIQASKFWRRHLHWIIWTILSLIVLVLFQFDLLYMMAEEGQDKLYALIRKPSEGFWTVIHPNITYHIIKPLEGVIYLILLFVFYSRIK